jgi:phage tail sheath protein FI
LNEAAKVNEVTLLLFPDAMNLPSEKDYYALHNLAIQQCVNLRDRFVIMDVFHKAEHGNAWKRDVKLLRDMIGATDDLRYAAVYFPRIYTKIDYIYGGDEHVAIAGIAGINDLASLKASKNSEYLQAKKALSDLPMLLPASPALAGIYAQVDRSSGVWKAPANININGAIEPEVLLSNQDQEGLNVDTIAGKSINAIRKFEGRGPAIVWGARTLHGNSYEWRYISVRRFFMMVEESKKKPLNSLWSNRTTVIHGYGLNQ